MLKDSAETSSPKRSAGLRFGAAGAGAENGPLPFGKGPIILLEKPRRVRARRRGNSETVFHTDMSLAKNPFRGADSASPQTPNLSLRLDGQSSYRRIRKPKCQIAAQRSVCILERRPGISRRVCRAGVPFPPGRSRNHAGIGALH